jgi:formylglycine-generating enzyme required for sulfatase activity
MSITNSPFSCGITQNGSAGNYTYTFTSGRGNFPVNAVTWGDAARFCNWLENGQPDTGAENAGTTEDGSYALNGAETDQQLDAVTRSQNAIYVIPSENEWYKAAYYKGGSTNAGYWLYPTQNDSAPSNVLSMTGTNNANYYNGTFTDPTNFLTNVGAFADSPGPYGTYDMGGDLYEWTEGFGNDESRIIRGGSWADSGLMSTTRLSSEPSGGNDTIGFRVAEVPEPTSASLFALGCAVILRRRKSALSASAPHLTSDRAFLWES